jgi:protocatechuate 3,4-dioxygenase beta subunit
MSLITFASAVLMLQVATPQFQAQTETAETATVEGTVVRAGTGEPIAFAAIYITPFGQTAVSITDAANRPEPVRGETGAAGQYRIEGIPPGQYRINVFVNGFVHREFGQPEPGTTGTPVDLLAGQEFEASFQLDPTATITGRVYDEQGQPIVGVQVAAVQPFVGPDGQEVLRPSQTDTTNDRGEYRLYWLTPGEYFISASAGNTAFMSTIAIPTGTSTSNAPPQTGQMSAFYPGVPDVTLAAPVTVSAADELAGVDVRLSGQAVYTISGRVLSPVQLTGAVLVNLQAASGSVVQTSGLIGSRMAPADSEGNFIVRDVTPGTYRLQAQSTAPGGQRLLASANVQVTTTNVENVTVTLGPGILITGRIFVENPASPAAAEAMEDLRLTEVRLILFDDQSRLSSMGQPSDAEGGFTIEGVFPGDHELRFTAPESTVYLKRILLGTEELEASSLISIPPAFNGRLDVLVSPNGARIDGRVADRDGEPVGGAMVTLIPDDARASSAGLGMGGSGLKQVQTDGSGNYSIGAIPPGSYRLYAWESGQGIPFLNADFMRRFEGRGERLVLVEGDTRSVALDVIPSSETR